jgi:hypothetical protein
MELYYFVSLHLGRIFYPSINHHFPLKKIYVGHRDDKPRHTSKEISGGYDLLEWEMEGKLLIVPIQFWLYSENHFISNAHG